MQQFRNIIPFIICFILFMTMMPVTAFSQSKEVNNQVQSWVSINTTTRLNQKFGLMADVHVRRNNLLSDRGFYFVRIGANYWLRENVIVTIGYGQMWIAPAKANWHHFAQENRVYQQIQLRSLIGKTVLLHRVRNEQRWQQKIVDDKFIHSYKFTNRVRYLLSVTIPVFKNPHYPSLVIADEVLIQFGKEIVYNTFDQNRAFIGIKQQISKSLNFDLGYMLVYQQKSSGYQYDRNHTLRCFFYYTPDCRKKK